MAAKLTAGNSCIVLLLAACRFCGSNATVLPAMQRVTQMIPDRQMAGQRE
jgi:hypothetical protein